MKVEIHLLIDSIVERKESIVTLTGHVYHPGQFKWKEGMRVSDVLGGIEKFPPGLDLNYALISRETKPIGDLEVIEIDSERRYYSATTRKRISVCLREIPYISSQKILRGVLSWTLFCRQLKPRPRQVNWKKWYP